MLSQRNNTVSNTETATMELEWELATITRKLPELLPQHRGKFALVKGDEVVEIYDTFSDALKLGCRLYGIAPFMIHEIGRDEEPVTRWR